MYLGNSYNVMDCVSPFMLSAYKKDMLSRTSTEIHKYILSMI